MTAPPTPQEAVHPVSLVRDDPVPAPPPSPGAIPAWAWIPVLAAGALAIAVALRRAHRTARLSPVDRAAQRLARLHKLTREERSLLQRMAEPIGFHPSVLLVSQRAFSQAAPAAVREKGDAAAITTLHARIFGSP